MKRIKFSPYTRAFNEFLYELLRFFNFGKFVKIRDFFAEVTNSRSMGWTGRGSGSEPKQRRPVALVVIVQIQWLCQGGGGPAATHADSLEFLDPLEKIHGAAVCERSAGDSSHFDNCPCRIVAVKNWGRHGLHRNYSMASITTSCHQWRSQKFSMEGVRVEAV